MYQDSSVTAAGTTAAAEASRSHMPPKGSCVFMKPAAVVPHEGGN